MFLGRGGEDQRIVGVVVGVVPGPPPWHDLLSLIIFVVRLKTHVDVFRGLD